MRRAHTYKCEATTLEGFIQQLAVAYVARKYFFYVTGCVPARLSAAEHDERMLAKFEVARSKWSRYRRRQQLGPDGFPLANVQYLRYRDFWVLLATSGHHHFFVEHHQADVRGGRQYRDVREQPICFGGYSIGWRGRVTVRLTVPAYRQLRTHFVERGILAIRRLNWSVTSPRFLLRRMRASRGKCRRYIEPSIACVGRQDCGQCRVIVCE